MFFVNRASFDTLRPADSLAYRSALLKNRSDSLNNNYTKEVHSYRTEEELKFGLLHLFYNKCAYCETSVSIDDLIIDEFRPMLNATNLDGKVDSNHYEWLVGEWSNLYPICRYCNQLKANRFPVDGPRVYYGAVGDDLRLERRLLLDPCVDDPNSHLFFFDDGIVSGITRQGEITIEILKLNRMDLVTARQRRASFLQKNIQNVIRQVRPQSLIPSFEKFEGLLKLLEPSQSFAGLTRQLVARYLKDIPGGKEFLEYAQVIKDEQFIFPSLEVLSRDIYELPDEFTYLPKIQPQKHYAVDREEMSDRQAYYESAKRIERIEIQNFKLIKQLTLRVSSPSENNEAWLALIGENGVGKSTVLQALALTLMGTRRMRELELDVQGLLRHRARKGYIRVYFTGDNSPVELILRRNDNSFIHIPAEPQVLLQAYGGTRLLPRQTGRQIDIDEYIRVKNLFDPLAPLADGASWLGNEKLVSNKNFETISRVLKHVLMLEDASFTRSQGIVQIILAGEYYLLNELSSGYQSVLALCIDIIMGLIKRWPHISDAEGLVLIDEIELHLHPKWKRQIVQRLRNSFPRILFIVTTHDPLCLQGLQAQEIVLLQSTTTGEIRTQVNLPPIDDLRADQVLTSTYFGLASTRSIASAEARERYVYLLSKVERTEPEEREFRVLRDRLASGMQLGETPLQRNVEQAIEEALQSNQIFTAATSSDTSEVPPAVEVEIRRQYLALIQRLGSDHDKSGLY